MARRNIGRGRVGVHAGSAEGWQRGHFRGDRRRRGPDPGAAHRTLAHHHGRHRPHPARSRRRRTVRAAQARRAGRRPRGARCTQHPTASTSANGCDSSPTAPGSTAPNCLPPNMPTSMSPRANSLPPTTRSTPPDPAKELSRVPVPSSRVQCASRPVMPPAWSSPSIPRSSTGSRCTWVRGGPLPPHRLPPVTPRGLFTSLI